MDDPASAVVDPLCLQDQLDAFPELGGKGLRRVVVLVENELELIELA